MFTNKEYLFRRVKWLEQISKSVGPPVIDKLNAINNGDDKGGLQLVGILSYNYPATFRVRYEDEEEEVIIWIKETRIGAETSIPPHPLNECKVMGSVIKDMFFKAKSPHFVFPVAQIITNDQGLDEQEHLVIYNLMEYLPHDNFLRFRDWIKTLDGGRRETTFELTTAVFQILYNLTVMASMEFTHGDLQLDNILISPTTPFKATYVVSDTEAFEVPSPVFTTMIDFGHSSVRSERYTSINEEASTFDPRVDMRAFFSNLFLALKNREDLLSMLFPSDKQLFIDLKTSSSELDSPKTVLVRYADQFWSRVNDLGSPHPPSHAYYV
jgi:serine/threonine protein kinase